VQRFDHSRFDWYPPGLGGPGQVSNADGTPRPALAVPLRVFGVHYGGAGSSWTDLGDTAAELRGVELNHARPSGKPNEYNSASDSASETWEYAGRYRAAHSSGNNTTVWGHLVLYGLEQLTEPEADGLIAGVRRARAQAVTAGYLTADHTVLPHNQLPGAQTSCPGPLWINKRWWARIVAPLTATDFDQPAPPDLPVFGGIVTTTRTDWAARRILDSRAWGDAGRVGADRRGDTGVRTIPCPEAAGKGAVTITLTAVEPTLPGYLTVFPSGGRPDVSHLNYPAGGAIANTTTTPVAADGSFQMFVSASTHVLIDLVGVHS
jgi:hypothetical protein